MRSNTLLEFSGATDILALYFLFKELIAIVVRTLKPSQS